MILCLARLVITIVSFYSSGIDQDLPRVERGFRDLRYPPTSPRTKASNCALIALPLFDGIGKVFLLRCGLSCALRCGLVMCLAKKGFVNTSRAFSERNSNPKPNCEAEKSRYSQYVDYSLSRDGIDIIRLLAAVSNNCFNILVCPLISRNITAHSGKEAHKIFPVFFSFSFQKINITCTHFVITLYKLPIFEINFSRVTHVKNVFYQKEERKIHRDTQDSLFLWRRLLKRMQIFHEKYICTSSISSYIRTTRRQLVTCFVNIFETASSSKGTRTGSDRGERKGSRRSRNKDNDYRLSRVRRESISESLEVILCLSIVFLSLSLSLSIELSHVTRRRRPRT